MQNFHLIILLKPYLHDRILILASSLCHEINVPLVHLIMTLREVANRLLRSLIQTSRCFMIIQYFVVTCVEGELLSQLRFHDGGEIYVFDHAVYNLKPYAANVYIFANQNYIIIIIVIITYFYAIRMHHKIKIKK